MSLRTFQTTGGTSGRGLSALTAGTALLLGLVVSLSVRAEAQEEGGAGVVVSGKATPDDVGLPFYPGAKPSKDNKDDSNAVRMGMWKDGNGFKLVVVKMETDDPPAKVVAFYKKALKKYGAVLDCTNGAPADAAKDESSKALTCGDDKPEKGGMLFKAGTDKKQHIVGVEPNGKGTIFQLVYVWSGS
jgi:hypothetical protein